ncbi:MAG: hypothetical protein J1F42_11635 [Lachnospiraceae bacterium]|nr:hypothetical protein [Lachnospiraceae bacterium]
MKLQDLKNAVNNIEIDEDMRDEILQNVLERTKGGQTDSSRAKANRKKISRFPRVAATAAGVLLAVGIIGIPVRAFVSSLVQERMEEIPEEEHQEMVEMLDSQEVGADSYIREYTDEERDRMSELYTQYQQGVFPKGELPQVDSVEEAEKLELCYLTTTSSFYLPDRELTDEELLQLIDFDVKRNYALKKRYEEEYADEIAAKEQAEKEQIAQIVDEGGITEEEAVVEAQKWLEKIYGITGEGLELNHYLDEYQSSYARLNNLYMVNWSQQSRNYYYFYISPIDGSLVEAYYSGGGMVDAMKIDVTPDEMKEKLPGLRDAAVSFMADKLGVDVTTYAESYVNYYVYDGVKTGSGVEFVFVDENGEGYMVQYIWNGMFSAVSRIYDNEAYLQTMKANGEARKKSERNQSGYSQVDHIITGLDEL